MNKAKQLEVFSNFNTISMIFKVNRAQRIGIE